MATTELADYLRLLPRVQETPAHMVWLSYDSEADVLYINYRKPSTATDSEMTEDDIIVRYDEDEIIGLTVLYASRR